MARKGFFDEYVDCFKKGKDEAKKAGNKPLEKYNKMMMNSLSGKFGAKLSNKRFNYSLEDGKIKRGYSGVSYCDFLPN